MRNAEWSVADAKSKLSEVLNLAEHEAQVITRRDRRYVVLDGDEYQRLTGSAPSLKDLILRGPRLEGLELRRDRSTGRDVALRGPLLTPACSPKSNATRVTRASANDSRRSRSKTST